MTYVDHIQSVLLVQAGALGDCVLQLRIAEAISAASRVQITWLGRDCWLPLASRCSRVDEAIGMDAISAHRLFEPSDQTDSDLAEFLQRFDLIVNGICAPYEPAALRLRQFARIATAHYSAKPQPERSGHISVQWLDQIAEQLADGTPRLSKSLIACGRRLTESPAALLAASPEDMDEARGLLAQAVRGAAANNCPIVLLHPGSGGQAKCWPLDRFAHLAELLDNNSLIPVFLLGEAEIERLGQQVDDIRQCWRVIVNPPLPALMGLITLARAYVGNDAGPTHLAAALGARTVAIHGPTNPRIWQPMGPQVAVLRSSSHDECWGDLPAGVVHETLIDLVGRALPWV